MNLVFRRLAAAAEPRLPRWVCEDRSGPDRLIVLRRRHAFNGPPRSHAVRLSTWCVGNVRKGMRDRPADPVSSRRPAGRELVQVDTADYQQCG